ncbi:ABC transporter substrate-binding protein [Clostridium saudiense]|uniref:ABC transporter substrate-binding protein n=1 Tax=Clostridium saudiense TaxID=1414720 RepID=UPI0018ABF2D7|nr:ABC transporter substrate-binding protein [Clostridium saudiense]
MKKLKKLTTLLLSVMLIVGLVSCGTSKQLSSNENSNVQSQENNDSHYPVTITTYNYLKEPVEITFDKAPERVVAIYQNSIETLLALGLEDKIVAAAGLDHDVKDEYKDAFSKVNYLEDFTPSKETIIMEKPDFILSWYSIFDDKRLGDIDYWNENGVNTYMSLNSGVVSERTIENEINDILNLGKIFNVEEKAQALVDEITSTVSEVSSKVSNEEKQSAMVIEFYDDEIYTYGSKTLAGDMVTKLGAELLNLEGGNIGAEDLIKLNPDCIFVSYMDRGNENVPVEEINKILENPAFASLSAVKNKRVYSIPLGDMYSSGIRTIDGINTFANGLYENEK